MITKDKLNTDDKMITKDKMITAPVQKTSQKSSDDVAVTSTNWSENAQKYIKPYVISAIERHSDLVSASAEIHKALIDGYGGTGVVATSHESLKTASNTNFYYYAQYKNTYIGILSSD